MIGPVDAAAARLATLPDASEAHGKPRDYFTLRRTRYRFHADDQVRFPLPKLRVGGVDVYDLHELLVWDQRRIERAKRVQGRYERTDEVRERQRASATKETNDDAEDR